MRLYFLQYAIRANGTPAPGYLVQTDDGTNILIDTGWPMSMAGQADPNDPRSWIMHEEDHIVAQLARIGLVPSDIRYLVCTHLDPDHAGNHDLFPDSEFIIQREQYEAATKSGHPRYGSPGAKWNAPDLNYRLIGGDTVLVPGVELIESSGHVPGHQAVLVRLPKTGPVLLAIDAIPKAGMLDPDTRPISPFDADEARTRASTRKLVNLAEREGAWLVHGHDAEQWRAIRLAPAFYD